jgi:hypothetical protein
MSDEQINIAIAEACGWTKCEHVASINLTKGIPPANNPPKYGTYENGMAQLPDYLNDLNAMHSAEKALTEHQWDEYERVLRLVCDGCSYYEGAGKELLNATAAQRAEAFLRTLGKWEETK